MNLKKNYWLTKWFVWAYDHLLFMGHRKHGRSYALIAEGTNLCQFVWVVFWAPLINLALATIILGWLGMMFIYIPFTSAGWWGLLAFPIVVVFIAFMVGFIFSIFWTFDKIRRGTKRNKALKIGAAYLSALSGHLCPLVKFKG